MIGLLALLGLGFLLAGGKGSGKASTSTRPPKGGAAPKPPLMDEQQRIVREMEEIAQGKRAELSEPVLAPPTPPTLPAAAEQVVRESEEIAKGERSDFSEPVQAAMSAAPPAAAEDAAPPAEDAPVSSDDEYALAEAAARAAMAQESGGGPPMITVTPRGRTPGTPMPKGGKAKPGKAPARSAPARSAPAPAKPVNVALAKSTAPQVAAHIKQKKMNYDRKMLSLWQSRAGVTPDGIYGRGSAAALKYYTPSAPPALFAQGAASYTPP